MQYTIQTRKLFTKGRDIKMNTLLKKNELLSAVVYVDYENIFELLKSYGKDPLEIDFFKMIQERLEGIGLQVIDFIIYANFSKKPISEHQQILRGLGFSTCHASNCGKNSSDLELMADALRELYENNRISVFVIISSDRDIIPLLKAIGYKNKISYVISTKNGFNQVVIKYATFHEYIEDIFNLPPPEPEIAGQNPVNDVIADIPATMNKESVKHALELAKLFYESRIWIRSSFLGKPVSLKGYMDVVCRVAGRSQDKIFEEFKLAHQLQFIQIYEDPQKGLCLREGALKDQVIGGSGIKWCEKSI